MIGNTRKQFTRTNKQLRRARNLHAFLIRDHILYGVDDIRQIVLKMQQRGFYSTSAMPKDMEFGVLRKVWRITRVEYETWDEWLMRTGWRYPSYHGVGWHKVQIQLKLYDAS